MADKRVKIIEQQIENDFSSLEGKNMQNFSSFQGRMNKKGKTYFEWEEKFCLVCLRVAEKRMLNFKRNCKYYFINENDKNNF